MRLASAAVPLLAFMPSRLQLQLHGSARARASPAMLGGTSDGDRDVAIMSRSGANAAKDEVRERMARVSEEAVLPDFNFSLPTQVQYEDVAADNAGPFKYVRDTLDADYHGTYSLPRQSLQDRLLEDALDGIQGDRPTPWVVFTAGAMGSGKSRTFEYLVERGIVPLQGVQTLDSDVFKSCLPEWRGYIELDPLSAGFHTRRESGYLLEIALEHSLRQRRHVWVDGSLRDGEWYRAEFERIRREHPAYSIAIVHVVATRGTILERVLSRAAVTGRHVPVEEIDDSIRRVPRSVQSLAPLADFIAVVDNSAERPFLVEYCDRDACYTCIDEWDQLSNRLEPDETSRNLADDECLVATTSRTEWEQIARNFEAARRTSSAARIDEWG